MLQNQELNYLYHTDYGTLLASVSTDYSLFFFFFSDYSLFNLILFFFSSKVPTLIQTLSPQQTNTLMYLKFVLNMFESLKNVQCCWMSQLFNTFILKNYFSSLVSFPDSNSHFIDLALLHFLLSVSFTSMQAVLSKMFSAQ